MLYESLSFAALKKLPIVFACENNFYSTHLPLDECRPDDNIHKTGIPFNIPSFRVDGNEVLKVYEVAGRAVKDCRKGKGPVFLEFRTYRQRGHVGPDDNIQGDHTDIRPQDEIWAWFRKDPLKRFERYLIKNNIAQTVKLKEIRDRAEKEALESHTFARKSPYPNKGELTSYVFKE